MPQADEDLYEEWKGPSEKYAIEYLNGRGYKLTRNFNWVHPDNISPSNRDTRAIAFLIYEWDYGGYVRD